METLQIASETNANNEQNKSPIDKLRKEKVLDHSAQQLRGRDAFLDDNYKKPQVVLDSNHIKPSEVLLVFVVA